ncbi:MAG: hypothetical protein V8Q84_01770 [Bilophila sp.]
MAVFQPTDSVQLRQALPAVARHEGPVYIRLFGEGKVFDDDYVFTLGNPDSRGTARM